MALSIVMLVVITGVFVAAVRRLFPEGVAYPFQGMFGYQADLGWPHGVQEQDGERAWVAHEPPAWDPEADELAWAALIGTSTIVEPERHRPLGPVAIVRVKAEVSTAPRHREPQAGDSSGSGAGKSPVP